MNVVSTVVPSVVPSRMTVTFVLVQCCVNAKTLFGPQLSRNIHAKLSRFRGNMKNYMIFQRYDNIARMLQFGQISTLDINIQAMLTEHCRFHTLLLNVM